MAKPFYPSALQSDIVIKFTFCYKKPAPYYVISSTLKEKNLGENELSIHTRCRFFVHALAKIVKLSR